MPGAQRRGRDILADVGDCCGADEPVAGQTVTFGVQDTQFVDNGRRVPPVCLRDALTGVGLLYPVQPAHGMRLRRRSQRPEFLERVADDIREVAVLGGAEPSVERDLEDRYRGFGSEFRGRRRYAATA